MFRDGERRRDRISTKHTPARMQHTTPQQKSDFSQRCWPHQHVHLKNAAETENSRLSGSSQYTCPTRHGYSHLDSSFFFQENLCSKLSAAGIFLSGSGTQAPSRADVLQVDLHRGASPSLPEARCRVKAGQHRQENRTNNLTGQI